MAISYFVSDKWKHTKQLAKTVLDSMQSHPYEVGKALQSRYRTQDLMDNAMMFNATVAVTAGLLAQDKKIYRIGKDLYNSIKNLDLQVPIDNLFKQDISEYIIEIPRDVSGYVDPSGKYQEVNAFTITTVQNIDKSGNRGLFIAGFGCGDAVEFSTRITISPEYSYVEQLTNPKKGEVNDAHLTKDYATFCREINKVLLNIIVYINSGEPDLQVDEDKVPPPGKNSKYIKRVECYELPHIRVGFNFMKPKRYFVDGCEVSGHFRWQPYGPGRTKVKLIFIEPFKKQFNKQEYSNE